MCECDCILYVLERYFIPPLLKYVTLLWFSYSLRLVGKVNVVVDKLRVDRSRVRLAEVEIGDETGTVSLRARDEQIDILEEVSKKSGAVVLRNCTLELYQGKHIRLAVTKWGKLSPYPDNVASTPPPPSKMNFDRNFSLIDLSVVASEMVDPHSESSTYSSRPVKSSENIDTGGRGGPSKPGGSSNRQQFQQSQTSTRRGSRGGDRRPGRGKGGSGPLSQAHFGAQEAGSMQPPPPSQMRYQGMHGFSSVYEQTMDVRQFSFPHGRQQDAMSQASAQQIMLQQQYEMQHRHMQQMYHDQHERHRPGMQQSALLMPAVVGAGSFEATGDYSLPSYAPSGPEQHPPAMAVSGSNPLLIPMTMPGARAPSTVTPTGAPVPHETHRKEMTSRLQEGSYAAAVDRDRQIQSVRGIQQGVSRSSGDESPFSQGKMNPQATAFSPSYMNPLGEKDWH